MASKFLEGKPVGVFNYDGRRRDDPNDRVDHEHRRELRGLRVIGSWLNDADRRAANTLDMYVTGEDGRRYVRHYLIDMGSALGSNNLMPHLPKYGNEYVWDPRTVLRSLVSFGLYRKKWEEAAADELPGDRLLRERRPSVPGDGCPPIPIPPSSAAPTGTDTGAPRSSWPSATTTSAPWSQGVATPTPGATEELTRLLAERRDMIGRYWFGRVNPLDRFEVEDGRLRFADLAVEGGLVPRASRQWQYTAVDEDGDRIADPRPLAEPVIPIGEETRAGQFFGYGLQSRSGESAKWSKRTTVFLYKHEAGRLQLVRIDREE